MTRILLFLSVAALFGSSGFAAGPGAVAPIGIAMSAGTFLIDSTAVTGPIDLVNGAELHTTISPSDVHLENGVDVRLATRSASTLYQDRIVLKNGALKLDHFDGYRAQTGGLTIQADSFDAQAIIRTTPKTIEVASIGGAVRVSDQGAMMTRILAGTKMVFQNTSGNGNGQTPAQTGAAPGPTSTEKGHVSDKKIILWTAGVCGVAAIVIGSIAAAEGKSPF
jgi:hypothetical protein